MPAPRPGSRARARGLARTRGRPARRRPAVLAARRDAHRPRASGQRICCRRLSGSPATTRDGTPLTPRGGSRRWPRHASRLKLERHQSSRPVALGSGSRPAAGDRGRGRRACGPPRRRALAGARTVVVAPAARPCARRVGRSGLPRRRPRRFPRRAAGRRTRRARARHCGLTPAVVPHAAPGTDHAGPHRSALE